LNIWQTPLLQHASPLTVAYVNSRYADALIIMKNKRPFNKLPGNTGRLLLINAFGKSPNKSSIS
jgi:hypothetical protein